MNPCLQGAHDLLGRALYPLRHLQLRVWEEYPSYLGNKVVGSVGSLLLLGNRFGDLGGP